MLKSLLSNTILFLPIGVLGTVILGMGALFKLQHYPGAAVMLQAGMLLFAVFSIWTLAKVYFSKIDFAYKLLWVVSMIIAPVVVTWIYHIKNKMI